eukprot:2636738-Pleurochrysis_carterae.AAC.1
MPAICAGVPSGGSLSTHAKGRRSSNGVICAEASPADAANGAAAACTSAAASKATAGEALLASSWSMVEASSEQLWMLGSRRMGSRLRGRCAAPKSCANWAPEDSGAADSKGVGCNWEMSPLALSTRHADEDIDTDADEESDRHTDTWTHTPSESESET